MSSYQSLSPAKDDTNLMVPIGFLNALAFAQTRQALLDIFAHWSGRIIRADRCTIALPDGPAHLKLMAIDGDQVIPTGTRLPIDGTLIGQVYRTRLPALCMDLENGEYLECPKLASGGLQAIFDAPLVSGEECFGALAFAIRDRTSFREDDFAILQSLAGCLATHLRLIEQVEEMTDMAYRDSLTNTFNRRKMNEMSEALWQQKSADGTALSLVMLDLDHFKRVNDRHGHDAGDVALQWTAATIAAQLGDGQHLFRVGGEEFALLLEATSRNDAISKACAILDAIRARPVVYGDQTLPLTASAGVATSAPSDLGFTEMLRRADRALYSAKADGRDRVVAG